MKDKELIQTLIHLWYAERMWAEELLKRTFGLDDAFEILGMRPDDDFPIPGTNWRCRTHGIGADIYRTEDTGGIDFDFDKPVPDAWRLKIFLEKQYNAGNLSKDLYRNLYEDDDFLNLIAKYVLE